MLDSCSGQSQETISFLLPTGITLICPLIKCRLHSEVGASFSTAGGGEVLQSEKKIKTFLSTRKLFGRKKPKAKFHYLPSHIGSHINQKWLAFLHKNSWHSWTNCSRLQPGLSVSYFNVYSALFVLEITQIFAAFCLLYEDSVSQTEGSRFHGTPPKVQLHLSVSYEGTSFLVSYISHQFKVNCHNSGIQN